MRDGLQKKKKMRAAKADPAFVSPFLIILVHENSCAGDSQTGKMLL